MVQVLPFQGLRYAPGLAGPAVVAPPYDVIDPAAQRALLARSPHNVVRLILGDPDAGPGWHAEAANTLRAWQSAGVLVRDVFTEEERSALVETVSGALLGGVRSPVLERALEYWKNIDPGVGKRIEDKVRRGGAEEPAAGMGEA